MAKLMNLICFGISEWNSVGRCLVCLTYHRFQAYATMLMHVPKGIWATTIIDSKFLYKAC